MIVELEEIQADVVLFGGDLAAGPFPCETIALARSLPNARFVQGNADRELLTGRPGGLTEWPSTQIGETEKQWIHGLELTAVIDDVLYCHATPRDDEPFVTILTPDDVARDTIGEVDQSTVVIGHTHTQFDRALGDLRLVNAGSVGMPYEDRTGAYWLLVRDGEPEFRRTDYDLQAAAERISATEWPIADRWIPENLLEVPAPAEAAQFFESQRAAK